MLWPLFKELAVWRLILGRGLQAGEKEAAEDGNSWIAAESMGMGFGWALPAELRRWSKNLACCSSAKFAKSDD